MIKHKFRFERVAAITKNVMALQIHRCNQPGVPDEWQQYILDPDELEELRRVLDIGMGDCDHCEDAGIMQRWRESQCKPKEKVISHDMTRLMKEWGSGVDSRLDNIEGQIGKVAKVENQIINVSKRLTAVDSGADERLCVLEDDTRLEAVESESSNALAGFHTLTKCIDDLKVELERVKTDMSVMKFALTTHMGMSHEKDK